MNHEEEPPEAGQKDWDLGWVSADGQEPGGAG